MDLITLAMAMQNGGGGDKAPMIVHGEYTKEYGAETILTEQNPQDIYAAAEAGRSVLLEWTVNGTTKRLELVKRRKDGSSVYLTYSGNEASPGEIRTTTVFFVGTQGTLREVIQYTDDITMYYDYTQDAWRATPYDMQDILDAWIKRPINIRAYDRGADLTSGQVYYTVTDIAYRTDHIEVSLMNGGVVNAYEVYEDGTVIEI